MKRYYCLNLCCSNSGVSKDINQDLYTILGGLCPLCGCGLIESKHIVSFDCEGRMWSIENKLKIDKLIRKSSIEMNPF